MRVLVIGTVHAKNPCLVPLFDYVIASANVLFLLFKLLIYFDFVDPLVLSFSLLLRTHTYTVFGFVKVVVGQTFVLIWHLIRNLLFKLSHFLGLSLKETRSIPSLLLCQIPESAFVWEPEVVLHLRRVVSTCRSERCCWTILLSVCEMASLYLRNHAAVLS